MNTNTTSTVNSKKLEDLPPMAVATAISPESPTGFTTTSDAEDFALSEKQFKSLKDQGFTTSLAHSLEEVRQAFAARIWIVDNSSSMLQPDGHRIIDSLSDTIKMVECTRWEEIRETVQYHIRLASLLNLPTRFRFLNHPGIHVGTKEILVGTDRNNLFEADDAIRVLNKVNPNGSTPLTQHIREIREDVLAMTPELRRTGQRVAIVIATDGLPTDEWGCSNESERRSFIESLRSLEGLPVWVVIRLCTDEVDVVNFYNDIDAVLELSVDVLDDFKGEAEEIHAVNPWINYGLVLHRMREMGHHDRLFDLIDERPFTKTEVRDFCRLIFGKHCFDGVSDPSVDWGTFLACLSQLASKECRPWNPIKNRNKSWVSVKKLNRRHGPKKCLLF